MKKTNDMLATSMPTVYPKEPEEWEKGLNKETPSELYSLLWKIAFDTDKSNFLSYVEKIKPYISQLLSQQRTQTIEEIKKIIGNEEKKKYVGKPYYDNLQTALDNQAKDARNTFRQEVLTKIDSLK